MATSAEQLLAPSGITETQSASSVDGFLVLLTRRVLVAQLSTIVVLGGLHAWLTWAAPGSYPTQLVRLFDLDREMNLPTWYASAQWTLLAFVLAAAAVLSRRVGSHRTVPAVWWASSIGALFLSADEVGVVHERIGGALEALLLRTGSDSVWRVLLEFPSYYWMLVYAPLAVPVAIGLGVFFWKRLDDGRGLALLGIFVFLYAAIGLDFIEGRFGNEEHGRIFVQAFSHELHFDIFLMEETLELLGVCFVTHALLRHVRRLASKTEGSNDV